MKKRPHREMSTETRVRLREHRESLIARKREARVREAGAVVVDEWNHRAPVGTPVTVTLDDGETMETRTRSVAWQLGHGEPVILVEGITGCYLLSRLQVRPADLGPARSAS